MDQGFSSESKEGLIDLETLSNHPHPCMAPGYFSIFNSPDVAPLRLARELEYSIDMDGVVVFSKLVLDSHSHSHDIANFHTNADTCPPSGFVTLEKQGLTPSIVQPTCTTD